MQTRLRWLLAVLLPSLSLGCARLQGKQVVSVERSPQLSPDELRLARDLADNEISTFRRANDRIVYVKTDLLPGANADDPLRQANVIFYRYEGDEALIITVDLNATRVVHVEKLRHHPIALAPEEKARAETLARGEPSLSRLFARPGIQVEFRPIQVSGSSDSLYGHRVVHVMLRAGDAYVSPPRVLVDLTRGAVLVEKTP